MVFIREVEDIEHEENIVNNIKLAARFIDLDKDGNVDKHTKELLNELKKRVIELIPENNIHHFKGVSHLIILRLLLFSNTYNIAEMGQRIWNIFEFSQRIFGKIRSNFS